MMNNHSTCTDLKNNFNNSKIIEKCNHFGTESNCPCGKEKDNRDLNPTLTRKESRSRFRSKYKDKKHKKRNSSKKRQRKHKSSHKQSTSASNSSDSDEDSTPRKKYSKKLKTNKGASVMLTMKDNTVQFGEHRKRLATENIKSLQGEVLAINFTAPNFAYENKFKDEDKVSERSQSHHRKSKKRCKEKKSHREKKTREGSKRKKKRLQSESEVEEEEDEENKFKSKDVDYQYTHRKDEQRYGAISSDFLLVDSKHKDGSSRNVSIAAHENESVDQVGVHNVKVGSQMFAERDYNDGLKLEIDNFVGNINIEEKQKEEIAKKKVEEWYTNAKEVAKENIERFTGKSIGLSNIGLKVVQCNKSWKNFQESFSSCSRNEISDILSKNLNDNINVVELFSESEKFQANNSYPEYHKNYVGLVGVAKIGKTELVKKIIHHYLDRFHFVFYLDLGEIDYKKPINLFNLLVQGNRLWMNEEKNTNAVLEKMLCNHDREILFIMDHLDGAKLEHETRKGQGFYGERIPSYFISNILRGKIFFKSKKIIVSRPFQFNKLHKDFRPKFVANVIGLTQDHQKKVYTEEGLQSKIPTRVPEQDIHSLCTVPISFRAFIFYLKDIKSCITLTNMFAQVFCTFLESLGHSWSDDLDKLSKFAYLQLINDKSNKFFFDFDELQTNKLDEVCIDSFFATELCQKYQRGVDVTFFKFRFSNLLVQEFLVAFRLFQSYTLLEEFLSLFSENLSTNYNNSLSYIVILFLLGFCNSEKNDVIKTILGSVNDVYVSNIKSCLNKFCTKLNLDEKLKII